MIKRSMILSLGIAMMAATMATAQVVSPFHIVPVIAKADGENGTQWLSDLSIANVSTFAVDIKAAFFKEGVAGSIIDLDPPAITTLQPGETRIISDVLGTWFPTEGSGIKGTLALLGEATGGGADEDVKLAVSSRTYNVGDPDGTFGQTVSSSLFSLVFGRGTSVLPGVREENGVFRTNVGIVNMSFQLFNPSAKTDFIIRTYDGAGALVDERTVQVDPFSMRQYSLAGFGISNLAAGRTEILIDPDTITWDPCDSSATPGLTPGLFITYMSKIDEGTGDAEFALGQTDWSDFVEDCGDEPNDCP